jgi:hypothetical protein
VTTTVPYETPEAYRRRTEPVTTALAWYTAELAALTTTNGA